MAESQKRKVLLLRRSHGQLQPGVQPIVLEYKTRKKKKQAVTGKAHKERYSEGLADVQQFEGNAVRIAQRANRAVSKGIDTYVHERDRSAREKTDGAIEDFLHNSASAGSAFMKEASELPVDLADSLDKTGYRKRLRRALRLTSRALRLWRI
ncbi:MAG TPA: hypothetical protein VF784_05430 [Anaerolineales bacterium]